MTFSDLYLIDRTGEGGPSFALTQPLVLTGSILGRIEVPTGFVTDLASIPQILWNILPPIGGYDRAAVVHDYLYQRNGCTRGEADQILLDGMEALNVPARISRPIYWGVRMGGWVPWRRYRNGSK